MERLRRAIDENKGKAAVKVIEDICPTFVGKHNKIVRLPFLLKLQCSNIGALPNSPTRILLEVARLLESPIPTDIVCRKLAAIDSQICEIAHRTLLFRYYYFLEFVPTRDADFTKMSVKELKQTLAFMGVECTGCVEKSDFVKMAEANLDKIPHTEL